MADCGEGPVPLQAVSGDGTSKGAGRSSLSQKMLQNGESCPSGGKMPGVPAIKVKIGGPVKKDEDYCKYIGQTKIIVFQQGTIVGLMDCRGGGEHMTD
ncbi:uncharacterized protein LOC108214063 isoform X2 [Daucus carota subsp. sativus]|uniref:uncharacterized protein LOC108214063 isoform X2 n=1 Tax=Daucus carota subsp. sativus TaxID=79200 RepID=UPI0030831263